MRDLFFKKIFFNFPVPNHNEWDANINVFSDSDYKDYLTPLMEVGLEKDNYIVFDIEEKNIQLQSC
ncbi:hypothetical protein MBIO_0836 [Mycoplasmopsis fermentans PG18]|uniref:Uncharacterized protein n=2 Tax=Mycoplasmopsis fermentans TaxID=2115 RepID=C4XG29_MYCFP|nr:Hypothetical Protein MfeM64YM_0681 [Mycoplasmopsis fermentans M64]BAH70101.1 hypothetical protein MBIO_0836 [Mycoplasmopsis fermentans PG18]